MVKEIDSTTLQLRMTAGDAVHLIDIEVRVVSGARESQETGATLLASRARVPDGSAL